MIDLSEAPYNEDYNENNGFHRILFRPGLAVQARDLIQRAHRLSPANPRLTAITEFMHALIKRYGIRPERVMSRLVRNT